MLKGVFVHYTILFGSDVLRKEVLYVTRVKIRKINKAHRNMILMPSEKTFMRCPLIFLDSY